MATSHSTDHLKLCSRYLDNDLSKDEVEHFDWLLCNDANFADIFARCALTHRQISELITEDKLHSLLDTALSGTPSLPRELVKQISDTQSSNHLLSASKRTRTFGSLGVRLVIAGIAAAVMVYAGQMFFAQHSKEANIVNTQPSRLPEQASTVESPAIAATVARLSNYQPYNDEAKLNIGDPLLDGTQLRFQSGLVKLTFECGAEVVLQGPCEFLIENSMLGFLERGNITANVPRRAFTFAIRAPGIDFIDLGTDFGICVDEQGQSELHVFEGEVIYRQDDKARKSSDVVHVVQDEAVKFKSLSDKPSSIAIDKEMFVEHFGLRKHGESIFPVTRNLALWLSADHGVNTDDTGHVISWHDRICGDNKVAEDAFQVEPDLRPLLVSDGPNGNAAIRFDGENDHLFTTSIETTDNQTVFIVCQFTPNAFKDERIYGGQILNYDGPPTRELTTTLAPGVLQIGEPLLKEEFQPSAVTAQVFAGFVGSTTIEAGRVDAEPVGMNTPIIIAYHYDFDQGNSTLMINGHICEQARAYAPAGLTSRKVIGRHAWMELFFNGDISELMIFNNALSDDELHAANRHLAEKYGIPLEN